ncbi:MAG: hypothetical protein JXQ71_12225 [Verrucomicrobia bacterium]|nr:hypothetical protein [Verrucomicrobiota bacterium]
MIVAAFKMKALEGYGIAIAGAILALVISPANLLGLPVGLWALVTLTRPSVKRAFRHPPAPAVIAQAAMAQANVPPPAGSSMRSFCWNGAPLGSGTSAAPAS